jgi:CrcB protein
MLQTMLAISLGASIGAWLRWALGIWLNGMTPVMPMGTLAANLIGGYLVGAAVVFFTHHPELPAAWRLFAITGLLGGLTTFSTFSAEVVTMIQQGRLVAATTTIGAHLAGSLLMTLAGMGSAEWLRRG